MAKGEAKRNNQLLDENIFANREFRDALMSNLGDAQTRSTDLFNQIVGRVGNLGADSREGYQAFAEGGGLDPRLQGQAEKDAAAYRQFATKGLSKNALSRIRGGGVYDDLVKTGGLSDIDKADIMSRAGSAQRSTYENMADQMVRSSAGGSGVSSALLDDIARRAAYSNADVERDSRLGISDSVREGRLAGASGMSGAERYITDEANNRFLGGMNGASGITANLLGLINQGKQFGLNGLTGLDSMGTEALSRLYGMAPGEVSMYNDLIGRNFSQDQGAISQRMQYNPNRGFMDHFRDFASIVGPVAGTVFGGPAGAALGSGLFGGGGGNSRFNSAGQSYTDPSQPWWGTSGGRP